MKKVDQTEISSEDGTTKGNCFSACLAMILDIPIQVIPNFAYYENEWFDHFILFLKGHKKEYGGLFHFNSEKDRDPANPETWKKLQEISPEQEYFIVGGASMRDYVKNGHAVVYRKDGTLFHDPHPSRQGLKKIEYAYYIDAEENADKK